MEKSDLESRVATLERELAQVKQRMDSAVDPDAWRGTFGMFADDPEFDEVLRLGREYREQANQDRGT